MLSRYLHRLTPAIMASVLHCGEPPVYEYLLWIGDYLKDREDMRTYLLSHGVTVPVEVVP